MFNALRQEQILVGVSRVMSASARSEGALDSFSRGQLLSASSVTRLMAAEQTAAGTNFRWLREQLMDALADDDREFVQAAREGIAGSTDAIGIGLVLSGLLESIPGGDGTGSRVRSVLREMTDREMKALSSDQRGS